MDLLISTGDLAATIGAPDLRLIDATYFALDPARDAAAEHAAGHIPGAVFMDLATLKDDASPLPGMLPPADAFAARIGALGIGDGDRIILYDNAPHRTAARAWWMFRAFGIDRVAILDGGLAKWIGEGRPLETGRVTPPPARPTVRADPAAVRDLGQMQANLASDGEQVIDARSATRFTGEEGDPRGLAPGHIPRSRNLPYDRVLDPDGTFRTAGQIRAAFADAGIDLGRPLVTSCGSGVTAAVLLFAAALAGKRDVALYDGSWSEWGARRDTPKAVGPA